LNIEYAVPLIPYVLAAYQSTGVELLFPCLRVVGSAGALFILNVVAAISYPDISLGGINDHYFRGAMLLALFVSGPGRLSIDAWLVKRVQPEH